MEKIIINISNNNNRLLEQIILEAHLNNNMYHRQQNKCYPKGVYLPISKLHSFLAVAILHVHNNISEICYYGQTLLLSAAVNCCFSENLTPSGVIFILLTMVHYSFKKAHHSLTESTLLKDR